uniref:Claudin-4-like n=2 Tax=Gouania willdenowi TaxID=441366 RepID=A0A8C5D9T5_GOUWI
MQCKKHTSSITMTVDIQAGRALTLISIILGILAFIVALLGGGAVNCCGEPEPTVSRSSSSSRKKSLVGGILCILAGVLCLISVGWSAAATSFLSNDPLVASALRRDVGTSIYIGLASSTLLLLGGVLMCFVCRTKKRFEPSYYYMPYNFGSFSDNSTRTATLRTDGLRTNTPLMFHYPTQRKMYEYAAQMQPYNPPDSSVAGMYNQPLGYK